ncbi:hypothetical protein dsx2_1133 [Desulfovibrio sp. X2]|uniref:hypothetical protein n=1 Tax=Desulfovibrio sp. X2 TaxID=941449 RepID=UPI00035899B5|nr:hypothetical protein [Desulfovibrio sp. X2]EPR37190.1 hypothetical protein dsx2_1133 [Desulfovibrio sp. X2]
MHYLLRIDPASREERLLLQSAEARNILISHAVSEILSLPEATLEVYTTDALVRREMEAQGRDVLFDPQDSSPQSCGKEPSPQSRTARALGLLLERGRGAGDGPVVVVDYRNVHLGAGALQRLREAVSAEPEGCFSSFAPARDHPALLRARFSLKGPEYLVLPEAEAQGAAPFSRRSRPFFFDWQALGVWDEAQDPYILRMEEGGSALNLAPLAPLGEGARDLPPDAVVLLRESACLARRVCASPSGPVAPRAAVAAYAPLPEISVRIETTGIPGRLRWTTECAGGLLRLWPMRGRHVGGRVEVRLPLGSDRENGAGSGEFEVDPECDGLLVCHLVPAEGEDYDCTLPLDGTGLWTFGSELERPKDLATNRTICNRQELPEVCEQDWSLLAGPPRALLAGLEHGCPWRVVDLSPREAAKVSSALHLAVETGVRLAPEHLAGGADESRAGEKSAGPCGAAPGCREAAVTLPGDARDAEEFLAKRRAMARRTFTWRQLRWLLEWPRRGGDVDSFLLWVVNTLAARKMDQEPKKLFEDEVRALVRRDFTRLSGRGEGPGPGGGPGRADVPGRTFAGSVCGLGSDGKEMVYVCVQREGQPGELQVSELWNGGTRKFGREGVNYRNLWFDCDQGLLYAFFLDNNGLARGIDLFDRGLRLQATAALPAILRGRGRLNQLSGNASSLFLLDYDLRLLCEFDKRTFVFRDFHDFAGRDLVQYCVCHGAEVFASSHHDSMVSILPLAGGPGRHIQNTSTLFAPILDYDVQAGNIHVVAKSSFQDLEPAPHWLHCLGRDGTPKGTRYLGEILAWRIHVMQDAGVALILDNVGNLQAFWCERGA